MLKRYTKNSRIKKPSYREVAAAVGRSPMHVWRVLNQKGGYSRTTERRVWAAYKELTMKKVGKTVNIDR